MTEMTEQPAPVPNEAGDIQSLVIADIATRREVGIQRYGTPLQPHNGRDALRDAYEEALDLAMYLRQAIEERANPVIIHVHVNGNGDAKAVAESMRSAMRNRWKA
jgi:hypothetical protein